MTRSRAAPVRFDRERERRGWRVACTLDSPPLNLFDRRDDRRPRRRRSPTLDGEPPRALLIRAEGRAVSGGVDVARLRRADARAGRARSGTSCWRRSSGSKRCRLPVVFAAHALTLTAAFELALACDLIVAAPHGQVRPGRESGRADAVDGRHPAARRAGRQRPRPPVRDERRALRRRGAGALGRRQRDLSRGGVRGARARPRRGAGRRPDQGARDDQAASCAASAKAASRRPTRRSAPRPADLFATEDLQSAVKTFLEHGGPGHATFEGR